MNLPILYEDTDVVAVDKPAGMLTHANDQSNTETVEDWFRERYKVQGASLASPEQSGGGYVHRLDRDTSGVLIFAKNVMAYEFLRKAFHDREVKKTYLAIVYGTPPTRGKEKKGVIDFAIGRSRRDFRLRSAQPKAKGRLREARTRYEIISEADSFSLLKVSPETGRTHQIRVHLKAIHHPIIGDSLYAPNHPHALGIFRLALHAYEIDLPLPLGAHIRIVAPIPADLAAALAYFPGAEEQFVLS